MWKSKNFLTTHSDYFRAGLSNPVIVFVAMQEQLPKSNLGNDYLPRRNCWTKIRLCPIDKIWIECISYNIYHATVKITFSPQVPKQDWLLSGSISSPCITQLDTCILSINREQFLSGGGSSVTIGRTPRSASLMLTQRENVQPQPWYIKLIWDMILTH